MTDIRGSEGILSMPPLSRRVIHALAEEFLGACAPNCLRHPFALDVAELVDTVLPRNNIHVSPGSATEMGDAEGLTDPEGGPEIEILVAADQYNRLAIAGPAANRARATVCHELGHALLHVPVIRARQRLPHSKLLLKRKSPEQVKIYRQPEWQAWTFAEAVLMPTRTIRMLPLVTARILASTYGVSEAFAQARLRSLRMA